jgi:GTPase Era involved in 16S rRNA processing
MNDNNLSIDILKSRIAAAYEYLTKEGDEKNGAKIRELAEKLTRREYTIAFCGHFSAGKSTMINNLLGENLLPSSPIPTSANLVRVKKGAEYAKVIFKNSRPRKYLAPYDYELVKKYCRDGDAIEAVEISRLDADLPDRTLIMDTPGIDSADDAHKLATESAVHLADLILYVMDYNHVQSELNFMFTRDLTQAGKEVYLVINQIDKHIAAEISFAKFQTGVADSFASWGVKPADIFYTSLKSPEHKHNSFGKLKAFLQERLAKKDELLLDSIQCSLKKILSDHLKEAKAKAKDAARDANALLKELAPDEREQMAEDYKSLSDELDNLTGSAENGAAEFDGEINKLLSNAYLMPFSTRALAEKYLEACQPNFKVGFFFAKKKTAEEKERRFAEFSADVNEKAKSQLEWHMREFLSRFMRDKHVSDRALTKEAQSYSLDISREILDGCQKGGAQLSGDYVLNYTNDVANEIKLLAKHKTAALKNSILAALKEHNASLAEKLKKKSAGMEKYIGALETLRKLNDAAAKRQKKVDKLLLSEKISNIGQDIFTVREIECEIVQGNPKFAEAVAKKNIAPHPVIAKKAVPEEARAAENNGADRLKATAERLKRASLLIKDLSGFEKLSGELAEKSARLYGRGFTVALFGAFSAGKSSFANALIGEKLLPVSPNPMTAAINKIKPIDETHPHGTVIIKLKTAENILADVKNALKSFSLDAATLDEARQKIALLTDEAMDATGEAKTNYSFLKAFARTCGEFQPLLGDTLQKDVSEFGAYAAEEDKSCFVEWIDVYYDCPLTRQGITLVDTPGADSINARHTGVAFEFIKNSDAILFVTYYNHAFSKADREFLIQLGRVKDAFQLDKMFFIINAIDLANDEDEKNLVLEYVAEQLIKYGVRNPKLYPLSSLAALKEKETNSQGDSGMAEMESAFYKFIMGDLANLAIGAAEAEIKRVASLLTGLVAASHADESERAAARTRMAGEKERMKKILDGESPDLLQDNMAQEITELAYYIKQRVFFRFGDFFRDAFNPSVLRDDGRSLKVQLEKSLRELLESLGFDLAQEMRATTVRLDRFAEKILRRAEKSFAEKLGEINGAISFAEMNLKPSCAAEFQNALADKGAADFIAELKIFKSPREFFEGGGSKKMQDALAKALDAPSDAYLAANRRILESIYAEEIAAAFCHLKEELADAIDGFYAARLSALSGSMDENELMRIETEMKNI